jgi:hypothetical protein
MKNRPTRRRLQIPSTNNRLHSTSHDARVAEGVENMSEGEEMASKFRSIGPNSVIYDGAIRIPRKPLKTCDEGQF